MDKAKVLARAIELKGETVENRRYLHAHPEVGFDIDGTRKFVIERLRQIGCDPQECGGGVSATIGSGGDKTILLRADMDALAIAEQSGVEFAADNGNMHACGHDFHTAMLLGAAKILKENESDICGRVKLMFQPAEEISAGALSMIDAGILKNPDVDAAIMIHVATGLNIKPGTVASYVPGAGNPAADFFEINVYGRGCHGSMPASGIDPITAAAHIIIGLEHIHARELSAGECVALTIGSIHAGNAANAIPDRAVMSGTLRTFNENVRKNIKRRMDEIVTLTAQAMGAKAELKFISGTPVLMNDADLAQCTLKYLQELLGTDMGINTAQADAVNDTCGGAKPMASEDFAYISAMVPTVALNLYAGRPDDGYKFPLHHCKVTFDETALPYGSAAYAYTAMRWLEEHR